jgi:hypothetical protein
MATIRIRNRRRDEQAIPDLCARCGQPTTFRKTKEFSWCPPWVFLLALLVLVPAIIVGLILTKKRTLDVPLCALHRHHFLWAPLIIVGGFVLLVALAFALTVLANEFDLPVLCWGWVVFLLIWVIAALSIQTRVIRPKEITDDEITLSGVAPEFVEEFEDQLEARRASRLDREAQERWSGGGSGRAREEDERGRERYRREDDEEDEDRERYTRRR